MGNTLHKPTTTILNNAQPPPQPQEEDNNGATCEICIEPITPPNLIFRNGNNCIHPFCIECIIKYIQVRIEDNSHQIPCPALNCPNFINPLHCHSLIPRQLFEKWCDLLCESAVLGLDRCYCPNPECSSLILNECGGGAVKRAACPNCKTAFCFECKMKWHAGYACRESREMRSAEDVAFGVLVEAKKWMRCPSCLHFVERIQGCNYIICRCGTRFCYKCGNKTNHHGCNCSESYLIRFFACITLLLISLFLTFLCQMTLMYLKKAAKQS